MQTNYTKYRGKCKQLCQQAVSDDPTLTIVRGYYHCAIFGRQGHWWCVTPDGAIHDPSKLQFPDQNGEYEEFDGFFDCYQCGKKITEEKVQIYGNYVFCSGNCIYACVM